MTADTSADQEDRKIIRLKEPIKQGSDFINELRFRRPKAGDLRALDNVTGDVARALALAERLTGEPVVLLDRLGIEDFVTVNQVLDGFLPSGLGTGAES